LSELIHGAPFDLIYIDADKANYIQYYEQAIRLLRAGGVMALDNMLSKGRVTESMQSYTVQTIHRLNQMIQQDSRVEMVMLPVGDGLTLLRKK
jgi:predicted O-methyltransferase YrrM